VKELQTDRALTPTASQHALDSLWHGTISSLWWTGATEKLHRQL